MDDRFEILTERLILRMPHLEDAAEINAAMRDVWHDLQLWMSWAHDGQETIASTTSFIEDKANMPICGFCRATGKFVIATGLRPDNDSYITGYWVAKDFLGQGYATEATNAVIRYAFSMLEAPSVKIEYFEGNEKSRRVIEKLGFTALPVIPKSQARCLDGKMLDNHPYIMESPSVLPALDVQWRVPDP